MIDFKNNLLGSSQQRASRIGFKKPLISLEERIQIGIELCQAGHYAAAEEIFTGILKLNPSRAEAFYFCGMLAYQTNRFEEALDYFTHAVNVDPTIADYHCLRGAAFSKLGNSEAATVCCEKALSLQPDHWDSHYLLSQIRLPGDSYMEVLKRIHAYLRPLTYVEIGVAMGESITLTGPNTLTIGIDPAPQIVCPLTSLTRIFRETSDAFFANHDLTKELQGRPVHLAFIDGLHLFEFALRDFMNLEKHCAPYSTILIHDCYPLDHITAARHQVTNFWSGDVWKLIVCLKKYRPDLAIHTIAAPPTGLGVIRKLDPTSHFIEKHLDMLYNEFIPLDYSVLDSGKEIALNLIPNSWAVLQGSLA